MTSPDPSMETSIDDEQVPIPFIDGSFPSTKAAKQSDDEGKMGEDTHIAIQSKVSRSRMMMKLQDDD